jgi:hypothetical protein
LRLERIVRLYSPRRFSHNQSMMLSISHAERRTFASIIVAKAGERQHQNNKTMKTDSNLSLANRKQLADMLGNQYDGLRYKAMQKFRNQRENLETALIKEYAEKKGAAKLAGQIEIAHTKIKELEAELSALDFVIDDDDFTLSVVSSRPLDKIISDRIEKELGTDDGIEARFTSAQIEMMTVASLEDAEKILNSVSALC